MSGGSDFQPVPNGGGNLVNFPPEESFQTIPSVLLKDLRRRSAIGKRVLEHLDIAVYVLLKCHARMKGECHPSLERMAALADCSIATMQRSFKRLEAAGHIQRKSHNKGKIFLLTDVSAKGEIIRRARINFAAKLSPPREHRLAVPLGTPTLPPINNAQKTRDAQPQENIESDAPADAEEYPF